MVFVNILSGEGYNLPGKHYNKDQQLAESPSYLGASGSESPICNANNILGDATGYNRAAKRCLGGGSDGQNAVDVLTANDENVENILMVERPGKEHSGVANGLNVHVGDDQGLETKGFDSNPGKNIIVEGNDEGVYDMGMKGKNEAIIYKCVDENDTNGGENGRVDENGQLVVDEEDLNDDKIIKVPRIIVGDETLQKTDEVYDHGDDEEDDGKDEGGGCDRSCCHGSLGGSDTDYNSDISLGDEEDGIVDDDDDDDDISDIDVQSFLAQLDEEIAGGETNNPAIDKGYAWIVVFAVFLIQTLMLGYLKSGGIFFVEFQRQFKSSASMTSLIIGLVDGIFSISAPFVLGFMVKVWSVRQLCMAGSFVFVLGVLGNSVFDRIEYLLLTHSFCFGIANGLMYGPSIYIINEYFKKKRALAMSISTTGASFGGIIFPLLARVLLDTYGFAGGIIMTAGVIMQIFIGSILLIPVKHHETKFRLSNKDSDATNNGLKSPKPKDKSGMSILETLKQRLGPGRNGNIDTRSKSKNSIVSKSSSSIFQKHQAHGVHNNSQHKFLGSGVKSLQLEQFSSKLEICEEGVPLEIQSEYHNNDKPEPAKDTISEKKLQARFPHLLSDNTSLSSQHSHLSGSICSSAHPGSSRHRLDVIYHGNNPNELGVFPSHASSLLLMSKFSSSKQTLSRSMMFQSTSTLNNTIADIISIDQDFKRLPRINSPDIESRNISTFRRMIPRFCDSPLLKSASFWVLVPFYFAGAIGVGLSQIFILPLAKERGLSDDQAAFCLSLLNMLDVVAHLAPGIILNFGFMTSTSIAILPMAVVGIVGHLTPFCHTYESIIGISVAFGLCMGFFYALQSLIVIDTLGIENYTTSIGIYYLVCGLAGAISYPVAGALKDYTGSYTATYQYLASMQFLAVAILIILPLVKRFDVRRGVLKS